MRRQNRSMKARKRRTDYAGADYFRTQGYLSAQDVADMLKCSERTVHYLRTNDGLPCVKLGRLVRFPIAQVEEWLEKHADTGLDSMRVRKDVANG